MNRLYPEEQIRSRLRELTEETRRVREELQRMIRRHPGQPDGPNDEQMPKFRRKNEKS